MKRETIHFIINVACTSWQNSIEKKDKNITCTLKFFQVSFFLLQLFSCLTIMSRFDYHVPFYVYLYHIHFDTTLSMYQSEKNLSLLKYPKKIVMTATNPFCVSFTCRIWIYSIKCHCHISLLQHELSIQESETFNLFNNVAFSFK
jgi:hypothetical protein